MNILQMTGTRLRSLAALLLCGPGLLLVPAAWAADSLPSIELSRAGDSYALSPDFFGFNEALGRGNFTFSDPEYREQLKHISPQAMRFPGGTEANFFHWKTGNIGPDEVRSANQKLQGNMTLIYKRLAAIPGGLSFDDFMRACQHSGSRAYVTLNLYTGSPEESAAWVRHAKDKGYKVAGWELGNELYFPVYRDRFPDVASYLRVAKQHVAAIRKVDPGAKIAVIATPDPLMGSAEAKAFNHAWNRALAGEHFYDAYVVHHYFGFPKREQIKPARLADYTLAMANETTDREMRYYAGFFGSRPMWMTEWNFMGYHFKQANDTHLNALFVGDMLIHLLAYPNIKTTMYHHLASSGRWPALFFDAKFLWQHASKQLQAEHPLPESCNDRQRCILRTSLYYPFRLIGRAIRDSGQVIPLRLSHNDMRHFRMGRDRRIDLQYPVLRSIGLGDSKHVRHILLSNVGEHEVRIDFGKLLANASEHQKPEQATLQCISRPALTDMGDNAQMPGQNPVAGHVRVASIHGFATKIPGYSFCILDLPKGAGVGEQVASH